MSKSTTVVVNNDNNNENYNLIVSHESDMEEGDLLDQIDDIIVKITKNPNGLRVSQSMKTLI